MSNSGGSSLVPWRILTEPTCVVMPSMNSEVGTSQATFNFGVMYAN